MTYIFPIGLDPKGNVVEEISMNLVKICLGVVSLVAAMLMAGCFSTTESTSLKRSGTHLVAEPHAAEALAAVGITEPKLPFPLEPHYQGPSAGASAASIKGSELQTRAWFGGIIDQKTWVLSVNGNRVVAGMAGRDTNVEVDRGMQTVTVESNTSALGWSVSTNEPFQLAQADLQVDVVPGSTYIVQSRLSKTSIAGAVGVDFWMIDAATGKTVSNIGGALPLSVEYKVQQAMDEYYGLPPFAGSDEAQSAHPALAQGGEIPPANGPPYEYTEQKDSASVSVGQTIPPTLDSRYGTRVLVAPSASAGNADVSVDQIDGLEVAFPHGTGSTFFGSITGDQATLLRIKAGQVWLAPGKHALALTFTQDTPDSVGNDDTLVFAGSYTVEAQFAANHMYRFTASAYGDLCCVTLWDATDPLGPVRAREYGGFAVSRR